MYALAETSYLGPYAEPICDLLCDVEAWFASFHGKVRTQNMHHLHLTVLHGPICSNLCTGSSLLTVVKQTAHYSKCSDVSGWSQLKLPHLH